jgi:hypothetical protein
VNSGKEDVSGINNNEKYLIHRGAGMSIKRVSKTNLAVFCIIVFAATSVLVCCKHSFASEYDNNIGFIKNVPEELKEAFPMCDQFLDVKWIREVKRTDYSQWVGLISTDIYLYDKRIKRDLAVFIAKHRRPSFFDISKIEREHLIKSIMSADYMSDTSWHLGAGSRGFVIIMNKRHNLISDVNSGPSDAIRNGFPERSFTHNTQNVCLPLPNNNGVWVSEAKRPFIVRANITANVKAEHEKLIKLMENRCLQFAQEIKAPNDQSNSNCTSLSGRGSIDADQRVALIDADGDGKMDYLFSIPPTTGIAFLNDDEPLLMPWPEDCSNIPKKMGYYLPFGKKKEQQCIDGVKRKYINE